MTPFEPYPLAVVRIKGTLVTAKRNEETVTRNIFWFKQYNYEEKALEETTLRDDVKEEPEEFVMPEVRGDICPLVGAHCSPETRQGVEAAGAGELNQEVGMRGSEKIPEVVVPEPSLKRGGDRYNLRPRITTPRKLKDYACE
ncbi:hypothetical protein NDU88_008640 [Pleurodeles waltl]|uniref:Uncharacterized protein n=1 Tax=Pleurodeles waltl TaxID=8319 RepID=A0AAV7QR95_PLEWA|nr:hypothetical protein NDU88_008640 [Pleurodeles waltl]